MSGRGVKRFLGMLAIIALAASPAGAQTSHSDFSGAWVLDSSKSITTSAMNPDIGQLASATWVIAQHGDSVIVDRETTPSGMPMVKSHVLVATDGKPWKNTVSQPGVGDVETSSVASWDGASFVVATTGNIAGTDFMQTDRWTLGADRKSMISQRSVTVEGMGEVQASTLTFTKKM